MRYFLNDNFLMRKYHKFFSCFSYAFVFILIYLTQSHEVFSQSKNEKSPVIPLFKCWDLNIEAAGKSEIASDNVNQIYLSDENGTISAVNLKDGIQNWKTELGGKTLKIIFRADTLYILSINETKDAKPLITLRALSGETGIVKWQKALEINQNGDDRHNSLLLDGKLLFLITTAGDLYVISSDKGEQIQKKSLSEKVTSPAAIIDGKIYVGTDKKNIEVFSTINGTVSKIALDDTPTIVFAADNKIVVGDRLGKLISFDTAKNEKKWQTRVGAEITDVAETEAGLAVSSNDNFIYLISPKNGGKLWKKRFVGRTGVALKNHDTVVAVNLNSNLSTLLEAKTGKIIDQISLQTTDFFIGKPFSINDIVIFHINTGLLAYSSSAESCLKKERPETDSGLK